MIQIYTQIKQEKDKIYFVSQICPKFIKKLSTIDNGCNDVINNFMTVAKTLDMDDYVFLIRLDKILDIMIKDYEL